VQAAFARLSDEVLRRLSRETSSGRFIPEMDGLRFIAISMVFLFHLNGYLLATSTSYQPRGRPDWSCLVAMQGMHGVELFFVISGFILALPFAGHYLTGDQAVSLRKYYLRRLTRLEPPYFAAVFLLLALNAWVHPGSSASGYGHLAASLFYSHNLVYGTASTVIGVAWSLEIEVQFYLLVPFMTRLFAISDRRVRRAFVIFLVLLAIAARVLILNHHSRLQLSILGYLQFFLIGFLLADIFVADWKGLPQKSFLWDAVAVLGWPLLLYGLRWPFFTHWIFPALLFVLYCAAFRGRITQLFFSNSWITAIGGMCYSIYLLHYEVISGVARFTRYLGTSLPNSIYLLLQFTVVGAAVVGVCGSYFVVIEKPCMMRGWPQRAWQRLKSRFAVRSASPSETFAD
jgi:peptidoglycan/LPS O-acetylase OafA/YrhL